MSQVYNQEKIVCVIQRIGLLVLVGLFWFFGGGVGLRQGLGQLCLARCRYCLPSSQEFEGYSS